MYLGEITASVIHVASVKMLLVIMNQLLVDDEKHDFHDNPKHYI